MVIKLDRFARSLVDPNTLDELREKRQALPQRLNPRQPTVGAAAVNVLAMMAEFESDLI